MFIIRIKELKTNVELGVYDWEKGVKRPIVLHLTMYVDSPAAGQSDKLADTVDYAVVEARILEQLQKQPYELIEKLVTDMGALVLSSDTRIEKVEIEAEKPGALQSAKAVSVSALFERTSR